MKSFRETLFEEIDSDEEIDDELFLLMVDFFIETDEEQLEQVLTEDQMDMYYEILDELDLEDEEDEELDEARLKKRISKAEKNRRKRAYRKNKEKIKRKQKKYRKTTSYKKYKKKEKRMNAQGKTSTGKRQSTYI
jgi:hypothetical protein